MTQPQPDLHALECAATEAMRRYEDAALPLLRLRSHLAWQRSPNPELFRGYFIAPAPGSDWAEREQERLERKGLKSKLYMTDRGLVLATGARRASDWAMKHSGGPSR